MGNWLESLIDWNLSRSRYWGTPLPIWVCDDCDEKFCAGSAADVGLTVDDDLHRPFIDEVTLPCIACGGVMHRVPDVIDAWYDSGAMPFAQKHYPFENSELFEQHASCRLHLRGRRPDARLVLLPARRVHAAVRPAGVQELRRRRHAAGQAGQEDVEVAAQHHRAEHDLRPVRRRRCALVLLRAGSRERRAAREPHVVPGRRAPLHADALERLLILRDVRAHRGLRSGVGRSRPSSSARCSTAGASPGSPRPSKRCARRWSGTTPRTPCTRSRGSSRISPSGTCAAPAAVSGRAPGRATTRCRRSRHCRRCSSRSPGWSRRSCPSWPSACTATSAGSTAIRRRRAGVPDSVHLTNYPKVAGAWRDPDVLVEMSRLRRLVEDGLAARTAAGVRVRQPLASATTRKRATRTRARGDLHGGAQRQGRPVRRPCRWARAVVLDTTITDELRLEWLAREVSRKVNELRKQAGLARRGPDHAARRCGWRRAACGRRAPRVAAGRRRSPSRSRIGASEALAEWEGELGGARCWLGVQR